MKDLIIEVSDTWQEYYKKKHVDTSERADELVNNKLRSKLHEWNEELGFKGLIASASTGEGNITRAPWFASYDTRVTKTATQGYYVVFLFSTDMQRVTLELGLGANQFTNFYGKNNTGLKEIKKAAVTMQELALDIAKAVCTESFTDRLELGSSNITDKPGYSLQRGYEEGAIVHLEFEINDSLNDEIIKRDYLQFITLYQAMIDSKKIPSNFDLLIGSLDIEQLNAVTSKIELKDFSPRNASGKNKGSSSAGTSKSHGNPQKNTKKIGDWGERVVLEYEIEYLKSQGLLDLAESVVHEEAQGSRPGWDITSYFTSGKQKRIEVKSTVGNEINTLNLTANELEAARNHGDSYFLYLVTGVNAKGAKCIERLQNPAKLIDNNDIQSRPISYEVRLSPYEDSHSE